MLRSPEIDAVHLVTPIPMHAAQTLAVLEARKHCACTVPMATTLADLRAIVAAEKRSGRTYMMMETSAYTREFLLARDLMARGEIGRIQLLRGSHYQDMENWPPYWMGLPPMHYATHAMAPLFLLLGKRARFVHCLGSGAMRQELHAQYGNPFPAETAIFRFDSSDVAAEVTRTLFHIARAYTEAFAVYGEKTTFEWQQIEEEKLRALPDGAARARPRPAHQGRARRGARPPGPAAGADPPLHEARASTTRRTRTSRSFRAAATAARTRTSCTSS